MRLGLHFRWESGRVGVGRGGVPKRWRKFMLGLRGYDEKYRRRDRSVPAEGSRGRAKDRCGLEIGRPSIVVQSIGDRG